MSNTQKPSIGRVVHFCFSGIRKPGLISYIHSDTCINVQLTDGTGEQTSVDLAIEDEKSAAMPNNMTTAHMTWSWPPRVG